MIAALFRKMILRITQYGEPILRQTGEKVATFDAELKQLSADMIETMYEAEGVGLAAQQVDKAMMICVIDVSHMDPSDLEYTLDGLVQPIDLIMPMTLVNPIIAIQSGRTVSGEEGCLSFPGIRGDVTRAENIEVRYQDLEGKDHLLRCSGWFARVVQHEVDHLNGRLFIDQMETRQLRNHDSKLKKLKRQSRDWLQENNKTQK